MFEIETQIVFGNVTCVVMIWVWKKFHLLQFCDDHYDQKITRKIFEHLSINFVFLNKGKLANQKYVQGPMQTIKKFLILLKVSYCLDVPHA